MDIFQVSLVFNKAGWDVIVGDNYIDLLEKELLIGRARFIKDDEPSQLNDVFHEMKEAQKDMPVFVVTNGAVFDTFIDGIFVHTGATPVAPEKAKEIIRNFREEK